MKAIHNNISIFSAALIVVQNIKDTNNWKQFTTVRSFRWKWVKLFRISKILIIESNSQLPFSINHNSVVVQNIKDTNNWKQFTTVCSVTELYNLLFRISKILIIESNSQLIQLLPLRLNVVQNIKDTNNWKQFTTSLGNHRNFYQLFRISKILIIESNSQRTVCYN